jgi:sialate O-acetylesterase
MRILITTIAGIFISFSTYANISLPAIFGDHMVLQQNSDVTLWGWGKPN